MSRLFVYIKDLFTPLSTFLFLLYTISIMDELDNNLEIKTADENNNVIRPIQKDSENFEKETSMDKDFVSETKIPQRETEPATYQKIDTEKFEMVEKEMAQKKEEEQKKPFKAEDFILPEKKEEKTEKKDEIKIQKREREIGVIIPPREEAKQNMKKTFHTFKDDVADILQSQKVSVTKIVAAEQDKKTTTERPSKNKKNILITVFLVLILSGLGAGGYFGVQKIINKKPPEITELKIPIFIFPDYQREVYLKSTKKITIVSEIQKQNEQTNIPLGQIIQLFFTTDDSSGQFVVEKTTGSKLIITTDTLLKSLETKAPSLLIRSLYPDFVFGFHSSLGNNPFFVFKSNSRENTFAGMLEWENTILDDLEPIFGNVGESTKQFKDIIIANKDTRAILDSTGKIKFVYSLPNKDTLVIANNETTLKEIFRRLTTASLERKN